MNCSEILTLLDLMIDDQLEPTIQTSVERHLDRCESCASGWAQIQALRTRLVDFKRSVKTSSLQQKILDKLQDAASPREAVEPKDRQLKVAVPITRPHSFFRPRTILCERHDLIRFGLKRIISEVADVVGEAADGITAIEVIRRLKPDFVILDVDLDALNGVEVCARVSKESPDSRLLILTDSYHATKYHGQLLRAGARGLCLKSSGPRTLYEAIEQVSRNLPYCDPKITQLIKQTPINPQPNTTLTDREIEVLIRLDLRNKEISEELDMKLRTVEKHIECILAKLKVPTRTAAALKAVQLGYVLLPKMPGRDPLTGVTHEHTVAELQAELAIANEHLRALISQNKLLSEAIKGSIA
jgi:DNA-binding NarL/FixJ family response regulator